MYIVKRTVSCGTPESTSLHTSSQVAWVSELVYHVGCPFSNCMLKKIWNLTESTVGLSKQLLSFCFYLIKFVSHFEGPVLRPLTSWTGANLSSLFRKKPLSVIWINPFRSTVILPWEFPSFGSGFTISPGFAISPFLLWILDICSLQCVVVCWQAWPWSATQCPWRCSPLLRRTVRCWASSGAGATISLLQYRRLETSFVSHHCAGDLWFKKGSFCKLRSRQEPGNCFAEKIINI